MNKVVHYIVKLLNKFKKDDLNQDSNQIQDVNQSSESTFTEQIKFKFAEVINQFKKLPSNVAETIRKIIATLIKTIRKFPLLVKNFPMFIRKILRAFRIPVLLLATFALSFSISAGTRLVHSSSFEKMFPKESLPQNDREESLSLPGRMHRIFFLKQEIASNTSIQHFTQLEDIATRMKEAVISVEDVRFYSHNGFDIRGIGRAAIDNIEAGSLEEGGSTITQQLIKNIFLTRSKTFGRKIEEVILAVDLEMNYSKDEILELYLNTSYFGAGFYGIYDAAYGYFGISPAELNLAESAMLAGLLKAPSVYSPYVNYMLAKKRQLIVLDSMVRNNFITYEQAENAKLATIYLTDYDRDDDY